ncbi:MAG: pyrroline-5-carboxylate reductase [Proteobacteria bacterium]|nr:pyrroline-5-carboxylate reductase [Pseudomonadota bacterium]
MKPQLSPRLAWELKLALRYKIGFIGTGNLAQAMIKGLIENKVVEPTQIYGCNRSPGKLQKTVETFRINSCSNAEDLIETCDIVVLAMKPQDLPGAIDPLAASFNENQIVISLAAGITLRMLEKKLSQTRIIRLMPNTPSLISRGVIGYVANDDDSSLEAIIEDMFNPLGYVLKVEDEDQFEALTVSCSSGTGFVFELMMYWQDWIEERGFPPDVARKMTVETFLGASLLASQSNQSSLEDLLAKVTSKKGITAAGLQSMRELEIERALRYSFEKAALRNQELAKDT